MPSGLSVAMDHLAECGLSFGRMPECFNTHIHLPPNFSAFECVGEAVDAANEETCRLLGTSNYNDFNIYAPFIEGCLAGGVAPLLGIEVVFMESELAQQDIRINDPVNPGKGYLCGKGIHRLAPFSTRAKQIIRTIRSSDATRMRQMAQLLAGVFRSKGLPTVLADTIRAKVAQRTRIELECVVLQERHLAQAYQAKLFEAIPLERRLTVCTDLFGVAPKCALDDAVGIQNEIRTHLMKVGKPAYVEEQFVTFSEARELIQELGGIPCYPIVADGMNPMSEFERDPHELIERLNAWHIHFVEFIANRNSPEAMQRYSDAFWDAGIQITVGTEHNTLDRIPIRPYCKGGQPIPKSVLERCWHGARLAWEHQQHGLAARQHDPRIHRTRRSVPTLW